MIRFFNDSHLEIKPSLFTIDDSIMLLLLSWDSYGEFPTCGIHSSFRTICVEIYIHHIFSPCWNILLCSLQLCSGTITKRSSTWLPCFMLATLVNELATNSGNLYPENRLSRRTGFLLCTQQIGPLWNNYQEENHYSLPQLVSQTHQTCRISSTGGMRPKLNLD